MRLKFESRILFYANGKEQLHWNKWCFLLLKVMERPARFMWIVILFEEAFKYGDSVKFSGNVGTKSETL
jgi:hypothetical protein